MTKLLKGTGLPAVESIGVGGRSKLPAPGLCAAVVALALGACSAGGPLPPVATGASLTEGAVAQSDPTTAKPIAAAAAPDDPWQAVVAAAIEENSRDAAPKTGPLRQRSDRLASLASVIPRGGGYKKVGKPYSIAGVMYVPRHQPDYEESGIASWYGDNFHGNKTANGEVYDMNALTAAHRTLPLPSLVSITNVDNGKTVIVRINDRGPFMKGRIIDVSARAAKELGFDHLGLTQVRVKYLGPAPLNGDDSREKAHLASLAP